MAEQFGGSNARGQNWCLPGGRYACALALTTFRLPFLEDRSLGEVCHIVQLAISSRQIFGYCDGQVVPHDQSETVLKQRCAALQLPIADVSAPREGKVLPVASLDDARHCLRCILDCATSDLGGVPLPNIKRLFRSKFGIELSETALGHPRLCDLLHDGRFSDICELRLYANGYIVLPACSPEPPARQPPQSWVQPPAPTQARPQSQPHAPPREAEPYVAASTRWEDAGVGNGSMPLVAQFAQDPLPPVARTFIHFAEAMPCGSAQRSSSVPKDHGFCADGGADFAANAQDTHSAAWGLSHEGCRGRQMHWPSEASDSETATASLSTRTPSPSPTPRGPSSIWSASMVMSPQTGVLPAAQMAAAVVTPTAGHRHWGMDFSVVHPILSAPGVPLQVVCPR